MAKHRDRFGARFGAVMGAVLGIGAMTPAAWAQDGSVDAADDDVVVTALKHGERNVQDVPVAVTAFGEEQLEALNYQDLQSLTYVMPNVQLEDIGTARGVANFAVRGVGINSSIPSVDPTVGVFVDGMYMGINAGILADNFDLAGIEVLRGPQGVLFGRNVTGGAVVIRTAAPSDEFEVSGGAAVEGGGQALNYIGDLAVNLPLMPGVLSARFSTYYNQDEGWFENLYDGSDFGGGELRVYRGALRLAPTNNLEMLLRLEQGSSDGDGPAAQNHGLYSRDSFDFSVNNRGYGSGDWEQAIFETNWDVGFGDGTITNILGWRQYEGLSGGDIDATGSTMAPLTAVVNGTAFHSRAVNEQEQWSNELRYAGTFGPVDVVAGHYMFEQELLYVEERFLFAGFLPTAATLPPSPLQYAVGAPFYINRVGGGYGEFSTWGVFANADWHLTDQLTLNFGIRYTEENKEAQISRIRRGVTVVGSTVTAGPPALIGTNLLPADNLDGANTPPGDGVVGGSIDGRFLTFSDQPFDLSWTDTSPRIGIQWEPTPDTNLYAYAARGFRSGGVNFRVTTLGSTAVSGAPTAFEPEETTTYEIGWKQEFMDGRARLNLAVFQNEIDGMQRETNVPDPTGSGVQQVIVNAGTATITGAEMEARFSLTDSFMVQLQAGYTEGEYDRVTADLDGLLLDCVTQTPFGTPLNLSVGPCDQALEIPRLTPWTYGVSLFHDLSIMGGMLSSRLSYNHRDENFYTDNNRGVLNEADIVDANFTFRPENANWSFSLYGNNLTNEVTFGGDTQLPGGSTLSPVSPYCPLGSPATCSDGNPFNGNPTFSPLNKGRVIGARLRFDF